MRFSHPFPARGLPLALALVLLAGCNNSDTALPQTTASAVTVAPSGMPAPIAAPTAVELKDVIETTPTYIVGIAYPQAAVQYPPLAHALHEYAEATRADLMQAVAGLDGDKPTAPYDLSLQFSMLAQTPRVVAVAAEGSSYTGGAHGMPLVERFVWLPQQQQLLAAEQLIPKADNWQPVAAFVREKLMTELSQRLDADGVAVEDRAALLKSGSEMIADGTAAQAQNFSRFEPVMNADGSIRALRFVFPPYQVGPYADGSHVVEVPARLLQPLVAPAYAALFHAATDDGR